MSCGRKTVGQTVGWSVGSWSNAGTLVMFLYALTNTHRRGGTNDKDRDGRHAPTEFREGGEALMGACPITTCGEWCTVQSGTGWSWGVGALRCATYCNVMMACGSRVSVVIGLESIPQKEGG